ncbi:MAG: ParB/RepB/Spo0J family partition protein, partial [Thermoanaerobaculia bacterium]
MRHDSHFVDSLSERFGPSLGRQIAIDEIETNPDQPRRSVGDLEELRMSIESKGVLEPILVRPLPDGRFRIIAGERRFRAAMEAGLAEIPCIELDVPDNEVMEIALIENLHRRDLHPFE